MISIREKTLVPSQFSFLSRVKSLNLTIHFIFQYNFTSHNNTITLFLRLSMKKKKKKQVLPPGSVTKSSCKQQLGKLFAYKLLQPLFSNGHSVTCWSAILVTIRKLTSRILSLFSSIKSTISCSSFLRLVCQHTISNNLLTTRSFHVPYPL